MQPMQQFTNTMNADAGFTTITYNGVPIIWDDNVPDDTMYFLNSRYVNQDARYAQILMFGQLVIKNRKRQGVLCNVKCPPSSK